MELHNAIRQYIVNSDPSNGGNITYTEHDVANPDFAAAVLARNEWMDGTPIDTNQRVILNAIVAGQTTVDVD